MVLRWFSSSLRALRAGHSEQMKIAKIELTRVSAALNKAPWDQGLQASDGCFADFGLCCHLLSDSWDHDAGPTPSDEWLCPA